MTGLMLTVGRLRHLASERLSAAEIAALTKVSVWTVRRYAKRLQVRLRNDRRRRPRSAWAELVAAGALPCDCDAPCDCPAVQ